MEANKSMLSVGDEIDRLIGISKSIIKSLEYHHHNLEKGVTLDANHVSNLLWQVERNLESIGGEAGQLYRMAQQNKQAAVPENDLPNKHNPELHGIRLEAKNISNQLYFLQTVLAPLAKEGVSGPQLHPLAIRGLWNQINELEGKATGIQDSACRLLGIDECTVEEEFA